ncbi:hypothetical protein Leryth_006258 [Lithospermum erythrorhizon]|nr:hypothetical protein Leryth_006258 [Lithospermum erythrorhizon]
MWLATYWGICESCSILSVWNTNCYYVEFLANLWRKRALDRHSIRISRSK